MSTQSVRHNEAAKAERTRMMQWPIPKLLLSLALPSMGSMLVTSAASLVDSLTVSSLGAEATGAVGLCFSLMALLQAVGFTLGMGGGSLISLQLGGKNTEEASRIAGTSFFLAVGCGLIIAACGFFRMPILRLLGASETLLPLAADYSVSIFLSAPFFTGTLCLSHLLRAEGKTGRALIGIAAAGLLNIALDPLLVGPLGIQGVSLSTLIGYIAGFVILLAIFLTGRSSLRLGFPRFQRSAGAGPLAILSSGSPSLLRQGLVAISTALLSRSARLYGDEAVATMSVANKIFMIPFTLMLGYAQGLQPLIGFNFTNGHTKRIRQACHFTLWTGTAALAALGGLIYWQAEALVRLFLQGGEGPAIAVTALRAGALTMPLLPACTLANLGYQAVKRPVISAFLAAARQGLFFVPLILWLPGVWGLLGVQLAQALADGATFVLSLPFLQYFFRKAVDKKGSKV